jgi:antitoxin (DNA-binding transcriptional repressor) of toxin-antitoxin stability system
MYNRAMARHVIHVSDAEAASDFASLLDRVRAGAEIVIEHGAQPVAHNSSGRTLPPAAFGIPSLGKRTRLDRDARSRLRQGR